MFRPTYPTEQVLKKHISYRVVLRRSVFMDTASVPGSGEVLIVRCLGLSSPEPGEGSAVSPCSAEEVGPRQSAIGQGHSCGTGMWTPSPGHRLPLPTAVCCGFPSQQAPDMPSSLALGSASAGSFPRATPTLVQTSQ